MICLIFIKKETMKIYLYLILASVFLISCGDKASNPCPQKFVVFGKTIPYDSIYHIGDTLTLCAKYNYMVYEQNTKSYYNLKNISGIDVRLGITNIDTICENLDSRLTDYIDVVPNNIYSQRIQTFSNGHIILYSKMILDNDTFRHEIKIIFKQKGLFVLGYGPSCINNNSYFAGKCNNTQYDMFTRLNPDLDNNINLLALSPDEHFNNWILKQHPEQNFYLGGGFAYKIID